jgi:hypothetical protein
MKLFTIAACAAFFATPAIADIRGGDVDLPAVAPVRWDVGNGKYCVATTFPENLKMLELIENYQVLAAATVIKGEVYSAFEPNLLIQWCGKR